MGADILKKSYIYKDCDNFVKEYDEELHPTVSDQFKFISQHDKEKLYGGDECYLVSCSWLNEWLEFVKGNGSKVGPIRNGCLVEENEYGTYRLKTDIRVKVDFRPVNKMVWEYYFVAYGGGPVIAFHGYEPKFYKTGKWIENPDLKLQRLVSIIIPDGSGNVKLDLSPPVDVTMLVSGTLGGLAAQNLVKNLGQLKMRDGLAMQSSIDGAQLKSIGLTLSTDRSVGRQMVKKARRILQMAEDEEDEDINSIHLTATRQMMLEGSALILQHWWALCVARRQEKQIRTHRDKLMRDGAVMRIQSAWRIRSAMRKYTRAKTLVKETKCTKVLQRAFRSFLSKRRMLHMIRKLHPHNYILTLKHGTNMNEGDSIIQDPYVVVTGYSIASRGRAIMKASDLDPGLQGTKSVHRGSVLQSKSQGTMTLLCYYKTSAPPGSTSPVWNEETFVTGAPWDSLLVLTYFDANKLGQDTCLGQNVIELKDYPGLYRGDTIHFDDFPIKNYTIHVHDPHETPLVPKGVRPKKGAGTVSFSLRLPRVNDGMCGWVFRASTGFRTSGQFKRRWMILVERKLHCFEDPYTLNVEKGVIDLASVTSAVKVRTDTFTIITKHDSWTIKWDANEAKNIQDSWKRKFLKSLPPHIAATLL